MKILLVLYGSLEQLSGGYLYDRQVVGYLRNRGVEVEILSLPAERRELRRLLQGRAGARSCDAVVIDELVCPSVFRSVARRRPAAPPVLTLVHHLRSREPIPEPLRLLARRQERRLLAHSRAVLVNSRVTGDTVRELVGSAVPLYLCPPGSDLLVGLAEPDERPAAGASGPGAAMPAPRPGAGEAPVRLLVTGNLIRRKGHDLLLRMLSNLRELSWRLRVVGRTVDRSYADRLRSLGRRLGLGDRVEYTGELTGPDLAREYRQADVFVFPSRYEGYGISLAEAVREGLPFVAFASGALGEVTGGRGHLLAPGDLAGFTQALKGLIEDPQERCRAAALSRELAAGLPGWADTGRRFHEALKEVIGDG